MKKPLFLFGALLFLFSCSTVQEEVFLFSYFKNNGEDGLHLAFSEDGLNWAALKNDSSFLSPNVGQDKLMRDPCIIKGKDGLFHMVWTVSWNERGIGYAYSKDLLQWSAQQYLPVMHHEPNAINCWAPELFYDKETDLYLIYWSTTIPGRFPETDSSADNGRNHRIYYTSTKDFSEFSETKLLYDQGFNVIDGSIQRIDQVYTMFLKDETKYPSPQKNIRIATSANLLGPYTTASAPISKPGIWVEGPTAIQLDQGWIVYFDQYRKHAMGAVISTDLSSWDDISDKIHFPKGTRHGTVFKVSKQILKNLQQK